MIMLVGVEFGYLVICWVGLMVLSRFSGYL